MWKKDFDFENKKYSGAIIQSINDFMPMFLRNNIKKRIKLLKMMNIKYMIIEENEFKWMKIMMMKLCIDKWSKKWITNEWVGTLKYILKLKIIWK